jgi:hypothetical protein
MEREDSSQQAGAIQEPEGRAVTARPLPLPGTEQLRARQTSRRWTALALLASLCAVGLLVLLRQTPPDGLAQQTPPPPAAPFNAQYKPPMFQGWGVPAVALIVTGEQIGYLQPCGCSRPQLGGLPRRYNFFQELKNKGWPTVAVDLGDIAANKTNPQLNLKFKYSMKAMEKLGYAAVSLGADEFGMPLLTALAEHTLNNPASPRVLASTLLDPKTQPIIKGMIAGSEVVQPKAGAPKVGIFGIVGTSVSKNVKDPDVAFRDNGKAVVEELTKLKQGKADITVLLYEGDLKDAQKLVVFCADKQQNPNLPKLDIVLCLSPDEEPPAVPMQEKNNQGQIIPTQIINIGWKGRYVGVVGVFPKAGLKAPHSYEFKYQLVAMSEDYETKKGMEKTNPIMVMMEDYAQEVKNFNYITKFPTSAHQMQLKFSKAKYVGSERCESCHPDAAKIWQKNLGTADHKIGHYYAFETLVKAENPGLRQHDGECVKCHVTGFDHPTGYADALRNNDAKMIPKLLGVGCESCHGPGSEHVKDTTERAIHAEMNPGKYAFNIQTQKWDEVPFQARKQKIDKACQRCHDIDNDVHWNFSKNWPLIEHKMQPKNAVQQPVGNPLPGLGQPAVNTPPPAGQSQPTGALVPPISQPPLPTPKK